MAELVDVPHLHTSQPWFVKDFNFSLAPPTPDLSLEVEPLLCLLYQEEELLPTLSEELLPTLLSLSEELLLTLLFLSEELLPTLLSLSEELLLLILLLLVPETEFR
jgi:hypothetical protein